MIYNETRIALAYYYALQEIAQLAPMVDEDTPSYERFDRANRRVREAFRKEHGTPLVGLEQMSPSKIEWEMQCALNAANRAGDAS